jgi:hypothetical protein
VQLSRRRKVETPLIASRPYTSNAETIASVRVRKVGQPGQPAVTEIRIWGVHERVSVTRT